MRCPNHLLTEVVGYCSVCGQFGCGDCITNHEGALYCPKHYKPIAEKMERQKRHEELLKRPERQRLVVRKKNGESLFGVSFAMNHKSDGFHLDLLDQQGEPMGKTEYVPFEDLKGVFYVKSFDGQFDASLKYREWHPQGSAVVVEFEDGEMLHGHTYQPYRKSEPRFHLIPDDPHSNNISILVEASALKRVMSTEEYKQQRREDLDKYIQEHYEEGRTREELCGDYHFERREYGRAVKQYNLALETAEESRGRLRKKLSSAQYNVGVRHLKQHEYTKSLACMKAALESDSENARAKEKYDKIKRFLKKRGHREPNLVDR